MKSLENKIAVITGASRGLGAQTARRLAADGAFVVVNYHSNREKAEAVVTDIEASGGQAVAIQGDVSSVAGIDAFYARVDQALEERFQSWHFDILVSNAGVNKAVSFEETTEEDFDQLFNMNVKGSFFSIQKAGARLRDAGRVILLSTGLTRFTYPQYAAYSATKGAIDTLTKNLAVTLGSRGITVNAVAPGAVDTDMNAGWLRDNEQVQQHISDISALKRLGQPSDIADVIAFLAIGR